MTTIYPLERQGREVMVAWQEIPGRGISLEVRTLRGIVDKIQEGVALTRREWDFLSKLQRRGPSLKEKVSTCFAGPEDVVRVEIIERLAMHILDSRRGLQTVFTDVRGELQREHRLSTSLAASYAKFFYQCALGQRTFSQKVETFHRERGRAPFRWEMRDLLAGLNEEGLLFPARSGEIVAQIDSLEVYYTPRGMLAMRDNSLEPIELSSVQDLSRDKVREIVSTYKALTEGSYYNNLGELLEFFAFHKEQLAITRAQTLQGSFFSYRPIPADIFDKYHSGTCILLSAKFCDALRRKDVAASMTYSVLQNAMTLLPFPDSKISRLIERWEEYIDVVKECTHSTAICVYKDEEKRKKVLFFECAFTGRLEREITEQTAADYIARASDSRPLMQIKEADVIAKLRLKGRYKVVMANPSREKILGVDFLKENVYVNASWAARLEGLPFNKDGRVSISFTDLLHPDVVGTYTISGVPTEMTHRDALRLIMEKTSDIFYFPEDFEENLLFAVQNGDAFFADILLSPMQTIKAVHEDLSALAEKVRDWRLRVGIVERSQRPIYEERVRLYENMLLDVRGNRLEAARSKIASLKEVAGLSSPK